MSATSTKSAPVNVIAALGLAVPGKSRNAVPPTMDALRALIAERNDLVADVGRENGGTLAANTRAITKVTTALVESGEFKSVADIAKAL